MVVSSTVPSECPLGLETERTCTREKAISLSTAHEAYVALVCFSTLWAVPSNVVIRFTACMTGQHACPVVPSLLWSSRTQNLTDKQDVPSPEMNNCILRSTVCVVIIYQVPAPPSSPFGHETAAANESATLRKESVTCR